MSKTKLTMHQGDEEPAAGVERERHSPHSWLRASHMCHFSRWDTPLSLLVCSHAGRGDSSLLCRLRREAASGSECHSLGQNEMPRSLHTLRRRTYGLTSEIPRSGVKNQPIPNYKQMQGRQLCREVPPNGCGQRVASTKDVP